VRDLFRRAGIENAELDARLLAEVAFEMKPLELVTNERTEAWAKALESMQAMATRRLKGEPVVRILGHKEFYGLSFKLNAATLVPRPETEMLVERVLELIQGRGKRKILDLGTGTGCIAISILSSNPQASAIGVDIAPEAVAMAKANAEANGVKKRFDVREGNWFGPLKSAEGFDVIVANPPYVASKVIETLKPEVREHDPRVALDGGSDGLEAYRTILATARIWLNSDGFLVLEVGYDQGRAVKGLVERAGFRDVRIERDLEGLDRMVVASHS
jgi:release factor glutamine methyltransferase